MSSHTVGMHTSLKLEVKIYGIVSRKHTHVYFASTDMENHRTIQVRRDTWNLSNPMSCSKQGQQNLFAQQLTQSNSEHLQD